MVVGHIVFTKGFLIIKNIIVNNNKVIQDIKLIIKRELKCINIMVVRHTKQELKHIKLMVIQHKNIVMVNNFIKHTKQA